MMYIAAGVMALLYAVVFFTGFVLRRSGTPYGVPQLTVHKLISLAAVAFLGIAIYRAWQSEPIDGIVWISVAATALFFIVSMSSGGIHATEKEWPSVITVLHKVSPWFTLAASVATVALLIV
jgi:uncharacterized membrane protein